jgi:hypothetical protein
MRRNPKYIKLIRQRRERPRWFELKVKSHIGKPQDYLILVEGPTLIIALCWFEDMYWFIKVDNGVVCNSRTYYSYIHAMRMWKERRVEWESS